MFKKIVSGVLCCAILLTQVMLSAFAFSDVDKNAYSWASTQIDEMTEQGIINGFEDGTFRPANGVTRIDALLLISRILGVNDPAEQKIAELAEDIYFADVNTLQYPAYQKNLAFLLYRGMFTPTELRNFLQGGLGSQALTRYEAAVLLVKMSGDSDKVSKTDTVSLPFTDTDEIPTVAQPFVYYCYQNGLMKGLDGNLFDPFGTVTRAQMAVILYNCMKGMGFSLVSGTVDEVSGFQNAITYTNEFGDVEVLNNTGDIRITLNAKDITDIDQITNGDVINILYKNKTIYMAEAITVLKDETVTGFYAGKGNSSSVQKIMMRGTGSDAQTLSYILADDVRIYLDGSEINLSALQSGDRIQLTIRDSRVTIINAAARETTVNGYITAFDLNGTGSISIKLTDNSVATYELSEDTVSVTRNNASATLRDLKVGDKVTLKLEYDLIQSITATSVKKTYNGTIEEIVISKTKPTIKIDIGSEVIECAMDNSIEITVNGVAASIYDMQLNYTAKVEIDSATVTKVEITSTPTVENMNVMGTVAEINTNYSSITLLMNDGSYQTVFIKSGATITNGNTGKKTTLSAIQKGNLLTAVVATTGFTAEAISIVVFTE